MKVGYCQRVSSPKLPESTCNTRFSLSGIKLEASVADDIQSNFCPCSEIYIAYLTDVLVGR
jgi:hypothetical protein